MAKNTTGTFYVLIASQMHNAGVFTPTELALQGGATHYLSGTSPYGPASFTDYYNGSPVHLNSGVDFENTNINLQGSQLFLNGYNLGVLGGRLNQAAVQCGSTSSLTMGNNAYLESVGFYTGNLAFYGEVQLYANVTFTNIGLINNHAVLTNRGGTTFTLNLSNGIQTLYNFGSISNSAGGGTLTVNYYGAYLYNYGTMSNYRFAWSRTGTCYIYHDAGAAPISCGTFASTASSAAYQLLSNLAFSNCSIDLNSKTVLMNNGSDNFSVNVMNDLPGSLPLLQRAVFSGSPASVLTIGGATVNSLSCTASAVTEGTVALSSGNTFAYLTNNGTLRNVSSISTSIIINNDLTNNGTITNYNSSMSLLLAITLKGSLQNNGTLNNHTLYLNNSSTVNLAHVTAVPIACQYFYSTGTGGYQLLSSLDFNNSYVDFNGKTVIMHDGNGDYGITLNGSGRWLQNLVIDGGPDSFLTLGTGTYLVNLTATYLTFNGEVAVKGNTTQVDHLTNNAILKNYSDSSYQLRINELLVNHGTIQNYSSSSQLALVMYGSLHNHGTISNQSVYFYNSVIRDLWQSETSDPMNFPYLIANPGSAGLRMLSNLRFTGCYIDLNGASLQMYDGSTAYGIRIISYGYLKEASLDGIAGSYLNLGSGVYLQDLDITEITLNGVIRVGANVVAQRLVNNGELRDYASGATLTVTQHLENYETIMDSNASAFNLALHGDLLNYGLINNHSIQVTGPFTHNIFHAAPVPISCDSFTVDPVSGELQLLSDLSFQNCSVNLGGRIMRMYDGRAIHNLNLNNSLLYGAVLATQGFSTLNFDNNSGLGSVTGQDIIISGTATIVDGCTFENLTVSSGSTVQTGLNITNLYCNGDLVNHGSIQDNPSSYTDLYLGCRGNLYNYGSMTNHSIHITNDALQDQYLLFAGLVSNPGGLVLESNIGVSDWYKSGVLQYEGYENITVFSTVLCVWKPVSPIGEGRRITISGGAPVSAPLGAEIIRDPGMNWLRWNEVSNALYYNVYVSEDPEAEFELLYGYIFDHAPGDGDVWLGIEMNTTMKFFKVTAQN